MRISTEARLQFLKRTEFSYMAKGLQRGTQLQYIHTLTMYEHIIHHTNHVKECTQNMVRDHHKHHLTGYIQSSYQYPSLLTVACILRTVVFTELLLTLSVHREKVFCLVNQKELFRGAKTISTSMYPPHSGAIGLSNYKQPRALPHFCYSFFLTASVPLKENDIFITLSMAQQCLLT